MAEPTLYERIGGIYAIAAVVDHFSDQLLKNPKVVEANPELKEWHTVTFAGRLQGLKFLRTLWVASLAGGPFQYTVRELRDAHFDLKIPPEVFDEVDSELGRTLDHFNVPEREKGEVLAAFGGWKEEVTVCARGETCTDISGSGRPEPPRRGRCEAMRPVPGVRALGSARGSAPRRRSPPRILPRPRPRCEARSPAGARGPGPPRSLSPRPGPSAHPWRRPSASAWRASATCPPHERSTPATFEAASRVRAFGGPAD